MWKMTRRFIAGANLVVAVMLLLASDLTRLLMASLGLFCLGSAARWIAFDPIFLDGRVVLGYSLVRGWKAMCAAYVAAGACALIAAFTSGKIVFAWIVTPFLVTWILTWMTAFRQCDLVHSPDAKPKL